MCGRHFMSLGVTMVVLAVSLCFPGSTAHAQKPIYPVYEGYVVNADGSYSLAFGYFNANPTAVTIEVGTGNNFTSTPADRGQPITFLPGHQRSVCIMVLSADFTGNLQWDLSFGGTRTITTEIGGINPTYLLESISGAYRIIQSIDTTAVQTGVCLNRPPTVRAGADTVILLGHGARLQGLVVDEGLPRHGFLTSSWSRVTGPGRVVFEDSAKPETAVTFSAPGSYELRLTASDSELSASDELAVTVEESDEVAPTPTDSERP